MGWARGGNKIELAIPLQFQWNWKPEEEDSLEAGRLVVVQPREAEAEAVGPESWHSEGRGERTEIFISDSSMNYW